LRQGIHRHQNGHLLLQFAEPRCEKLLSLLGALAAFALCATEEVGEFGVAGPVGVSNVGL
jgi:hypothetical protein